MKKLFLVLVFSLMLGSFCFSATVDDVVKLYNKVKVVKIGEESIYWWQLTPEQVGRANLDIPTLIRDIEAIAENTSNNNDVRVLAYTYLGNIYRIKGATQDLEKSKENYLKALELDPKFYGVGYEICNVITKEEAETLYQKTKNLGLLNRMILLKKAKPERSLEYLNSVTRQNYDIKLIELCIKNLPTDFILSADYQVLLKKLYSIIPSLPANVEVKSLIVSEMLPKTREELGIK